MHPNTTKTPTLRQVNNHVTSITVSEADYAWVRALGPRAIHYESEGGPAGYTITLTEKVGQQ